MLGLGRPVIWVCSKSDFAKVHFDTRQYNTIVYENTDELKKRLQFRIEAILGKGPIPA
jgi:major membrane immunogen (membrane-anchored lipoprotein)